MGSYHGSVFKIQLVDGSWKAKLWRTLPGPPLDSLLMKEGRLMIVCSEGALFLRPDGRIEWLGVPPD